MKALIVVDMQNDFMPGGTLATPRAYELVPLINQLMEKFPVVLATKDWHPKDHMSFAENHPGKNVGDIIVVKGYEQILWPMHCVQETNGAEFVAGLDVDRFEEVFKKGIDREIDSYSTFFDNAKMRKTGLEDYLRKKGINDITVVGVATDFCVLFSVIDARALGFDVTVIKDATRAINLKPGDDQEAFNAMKRVGANLITSDEVLK